MYDIEEIEALIDQRVASVPLEHWSNADLLMMAVQMRLRPVDPAVPAPRRGRPRKDAAAELKGLADS